MTASQVVTNLMWIYIGVLITVICAKTGLAEVDRDTNVITHILIFALILSTEALLSALGY